MRDIKRAIRDASGLSLESTGSMKARGLRKVPSSGKAGLDPYDSDSLKKPDGGRQPKDLRKLSEWIKAQRQVIALRRDEALTADEPSGVLRNLLQSLLRRR